MPRLGPYTGVSTKKIDKLCDVILSGNYKNQADALRKAGYSEKVVTHRAADVMARVAPRLAERRGQEMAYYHNGETGNAIGVTREEVVNRWRDIALNQDRDVSTSFRALQGMGKYVGLDMTTDEQKESKAPVINIGIINKNGEEGTLRVEAKEAPQKLENSTQSEEIPKNDADND